MISIDRTQPELQLELTPLLDIVFLVVVFLLLTANTRLQHLDIDLPSTESLINGETANKPIQVGINSTVPVWQLNDKTFAQWTEFKTALERDIAAAPNASILINTARDAQVQPLMELMSLLSQAGITQTQILLEHHSEN
ncbi:biopolymer transporter ExbD [Simiduia litorea]|uniref:ExbD/TolR family protein n=1 Tax=Simiduia litorea TaxID=1435348 RepID=UPI0036F31DD9